MSGGRRVPTVVSLLGWACRGRLVSLLGARVGRGGRRAGRGGPGRGGRYRWVRPRLPPPLGQSCARSAAPLAQVAFAQSAVSAAVSAGPSSPRRLPVAAPRRGL